MAELQCQKCRRAVRIDGSLESLNGASFNILAEAAPVLQPQPPPSPPRSAAALERKQLFHEVAARPAGPPVYQSNHARTSGPQPPPDMSYIMLSDSNHLVPQSESKKQTATTTTTTTTTVAAGKRAESRSIADGKKTLSREMHSTMRLFDILSARSDIDHPICAECTELVLEGLQKRQAVVSRERDAYVDFLKSAQQQLPTDEDRSKTQHRLGDAQRREQEALRELEALEAEKARMEDEIAALDAEAEMLDDEEEQFWRERNAFTAEWATVQHERDSLQMQLAHDTKTLEALQRTNVYNDTFCIGHDGTFGTINGLRLGRTPDHAVDWPEINAAWGQTLLLLTVVMEKLGIQLQGFELVPVGSTSKVVKIEQAPNTADGKPKKTVFELFSSGDLPLGLGFLHRNFDNAMVAFLECLRQVGEHVGRVPSRSGSSVAKIPYPIVKDKIGGVSIKLGNFGQEEQWTKACKYTLTCCKHLLAHASHVADSAR